MQYFDTSLSAVHILDDQDSSKSRVFAVIRSIEVVGCGNIVHCFTSCVI